MNVTRAAAVALIAFSGLAVPAAGAVHADGNQPLLCGLLSPCDQSSSTDDGDDGGDDTSAPTDIDIDPNLGLDLGADPGTPNPDTDLGTDINADVAADAKIELFPQNGTLLAADTDVTAAGVQANVLNHTVDAAADAVLDTDATVGHGVVVTANGAADAQANVNAAGRQLVSADASNQVCGVQVVIAASSTSNCTPTGSHNVIGGGDGLIAVAESLDLCGAHVVVAGSASTTCGDPSASGSQGASSSWTLADAAVTGTVCGLSVAVLGESSTSCGSEQEAPVPGAGSNGPGTGTPGTGTTPQVSNGNGNAAGNASGAGTGTGSGTSSGNGSGLASSPSAQPAQVGGDSGAATGDSGGTLPLTGMSILLILTVAGITLAAGLVAVRSSRVRIGHQS